MSLRVFVSVVAVCLSSPQWTSAQIVVPHDAPAIASAGDRAEPGAAIAPAADQGIVLPPAPAPAPGGFTFGAPAPKNPFTSVGHDLKTFFTQKDTRVILGMFVPAAAVAHTWDEAGIRESQQHLRDSHFEVGNIGGNFLVQTGAAIGTWAIGKAIDNPTTAAVGADLVRAQFVSQIVVQGVKFATRRERPDASNNHSFPSGHTASAFATASVLSRHLGWKAGVPAYGFATYVAMSRMAANKHHMSDVIMGAAVGLAAGRAVTVGVGGAKFDLGVAPTQGGAAVTFTKR
jgi:membrane-associated phospholipid phosphatase